MITKDQKQILEAVLESLPEKLEKSNYKPPTWIKDKLLQPEYANERVWGFNQALDDVRAIINEFLEPEDQTVTISQAGATQAELDNILQQRITSLNYWDSPGLPPIKKKKGNLPKLKKLAKSIREQEKPKQEYPWMAGVKEQLDRITIRKSKEDRNE